MGRKKWKPPDYIIPAPAEAFKRPGADPADPLGDELIGTDVLAKMLDTSRSNVYKMHARGKLPRATLTVGDRRGLRWRLRRDIYEWMKNGCPVRDIAQEDKEGKEMGNGKEEAKEGG